MTNPETSRDLVKRLREHEGLGAALAHDSGQTGRYVSAVMDEAATTIERLTAEWTFCPECGSEEIRYEEGRHKQCAGCGQEWFSDLNYVDVVAKNLRRLTAERDEARAKNKSSWMPRFASMLSRVETAERDAATAEARADTAVAALRRAFGCIAFPVSTDIDPRGYSLYHVSERLEYAAEVLSAAIAATPPAIDWKARALATESSNG